MNLFMAPSAQRYQIAGLVSSTIQSTNQAMCVGAHLVIAAQLAWLGSYPRVELAIASALSSLSRLTEGLVVLNAEALRFMQSRTALNRTHAFGPAISELHPALCTTQGAVSSIAGQSSAIHTAVVQANGIRFARNLGTILASLRATVTKFAAIGAGFGQAISHGITPFTKEYTMPIAKGLKLRQGL